MRQQGRNCPVCQHQSSDFITSVDYALWDDLNMSGQADIVACDQCGMVYHQTQASEQDFSRYYERNDYYASADTLGAGGLSKEETARYQRLDQLLAPYLKSQSPRIVDVGAGKGGFLHYCKEKGFLDLLAVEASASCADLIRAELNIPVYSHVERLIENSTTVDVIVLSHVLEHVFQPLALLKTVLSLANQETLFYIEVPNALFYINEKNPWQHVYFEHINHFDSTHIESLLAQVGLECLLSTQAAFLPEKGSDNECCIVLAKKGRPVLEPQNRLLYQAMTKALMYSGHFLALDAVLSERSQALAIWGISQYTQLMIAKTPALQQHLHYLLDQSTAKCGRLIYGHPVECWKKVLRLNKQNTLLIPENIFSQGMKNTLDQAGFSGKVILF